MDALLGWHPEDTSVFLIDPQVDLAVSVYEVVGIDNSRPVGKHTGKGIASVGLAKREKLLSTEEREALLPRRWHELTPETERFTIPK